MDELLAASQPTDWRTPRVEDLLYLDLPGGRVIIELAPQFAPQHASNIRALAHAGYWNGLSINRVQDNFVTQWGDPADDPAQRRSLGAAAEHLPAEFSRPARGLPFHRLPDGDGWAREVGFVDGFPVARESARGQAWLAHCYGMVGAGRDNAADSSNGSELYVVIGQSPRQLDRNITVVGRVLEGMPLLAALPRGDGPLGFYTRPAIRVPITAARLASDLPAGERVPIEVLRTDTPLFDAIIEARRNRHDAWYVRAAGHIGLCNVPLPVRRQKLP